MKSFQSNPTHLRWVENESRGSESPGRALAGWQYWPPGYWQPAGKLGARRARNTAEIWNKYYDVVATKSAAAFNKTGCGRVTAIAPHPLRLWMSCQHVHVPIQKCIFWGVRQDFKAPEAAKVKLGCVKGFLHPTDIQIHVSWGTRLRKQCKQGA